MDYKIVQIIPAPAGMYISPWTKNDHWGDRQRVVGLALRECIDLNSEMHGYREVVPLTACGGDLEAHAPGEYEESWN